MNKVSTIVLSVLIIFVPIAIGVVSYITAFNSGNFYENQLMAISRNNENILAQYGQKVSEAAQVPSMQKDAIKELFQSANEARYGKDGSKAMFQMLKEQNPNIEQATFVQLQRIIEAGRNEFTTNQTKLIDVRRSYETNLGTFWSGFWLKVAGYPKQDLSKFDIVSTDRASEAFTTKREQPLKLGK
jgi:hypothetical protein